MMPVRSVEMRNGRASLPQTPIDWPIALGRVALWLAIVAFGGPFFAINGGFSVQGLGVVCAAFNSAGRLFWELIVTIQFDLPVQVSDLPSSQPLIPWIGVIAASILQVCALWLKLSGRPIPLWMVIATLLLSVYDFTTTFFGAGTVAWIAAAGLVVQIAIALILTFGLELAIGFLLPRRPKAS